MAIDLAACGLLKTDGDWDSKHPRTGTSPNPGWFATTGGSSPSPEDAKPKDASPGQAFAPPAVGLSLMSRSLPALAVEGLAALASRLSVATVLFGALFVPSSNDIVEEGAVPGRDDLSYRWARDETTATFRALVDGEWVTIAEGTRGADNLFRDEEGDVVARVVSGPDQKETLVADVGALDAAAAELRGNASHPLAVDEASDDRPKLCPDPSPEPKTTTSANSISYQEYVSKLPYGLAINVGDVTFDGCDPETGTLLEAKADIDFMFDSNSSIWGWVKPENNPKWQMQDQAEAAALAGRSVIWHAQTKTGYLALSKIAEALKLANLSVVYDPNR